MRSYRFFAHFGMELKAVGITELVTGPHGYQLTINSYYAGSLVKLHSEWVLHTNNFGLEWSDIMELGEIVENNFSQNINYF